MKKSLAFLLCNVAIAVTLAGAQSSGSSFIAQNIANFTGDQSGATLSPLPTQLVNHTVINTGSCQFNLGSMSPFSSSGDHSFNIPANFNFPASNVSACLGDLQAFLGSLDFNSGQFLTDLDNLLNKCHVDPQLISAIETWVQNHHSDGGNFDIEPIPPESDEGIGSNDGDDVAVAIPEPSSIALMVGGAALLGGVLLRRRARV